MLLRPLLPVALLALLLCACGNPQEEARRELGRKKITYDTATFVGYARSGNQEVVNLFLQAGMSPNVTGPGGETPLQGAARFNREAVVKLLLEKGADPNVTEPAQGATPLMWAAVGGFDGVVQALLDKGADVNAKNAKSGMTALRKASEELFPLP